MLRRVGVVLLVAVVVAAAGAAWYLRPIAPIATGYAAQVVCGAVHLQGRSVASGSEDLPDNPLVPFLRVRADDTGVDATLLGLAGSRAERVPGAGCRLVDDATAPVADVAPVEAGADDLVTPADPSIAATAAGIDVTALTSAIDAAFTEDDDPTTHRGTRAVVVVHRGQVVAERYADGVGPETPLLGWSMSKSVAHAMVGRLVLDGGVATGDSALLPDWDGPRAAITLDQLLRMSSGLAFEEVYDPGTDATRMLFTPRDAGGFAADQPLAADPGTRWSYSSGTTNIVCDVVADADGRASASLARDLVFAPLSMTSATIGLDSSGDPVCSSFVYATARDWARFGLLYLQEGVWGGERVLPDGWARYAATPVDLPTTDDDGAVTPYGAHWWLNSDRDGALRFPSMPDDAYWASGNEGQQVVVLPSHDAVVVRLGLTRGLSSTGWGLEAMVAGVVDALP